MDIPGQHFAAARSKRFLWKCFACISRLHWAASDPVHHMYIEENALLQILCLLEMLGGGLVKGRYPQFLLLPVHPKWTPQIPPYTKRVDMSCMPPDTVSLLFLS